MTRPIVNLSYYLNWENEFEYEKKRIADVLGDKFQGLEHIRSTSIKGLVAKPIIDIIVGVQDLDEVPNFVIPLSKIEYEYVHLPEFKYRRFFRKGLWGRVLVILHICEINSGEWMEKLLFRDYLRLYP